MEKKLHMFRRKIMTIMCKKLTIRSWTILIWKSDSKSYPNKLEKNENDRFNWTVKFNFCKISQQNVCPDFRALYSSQPMSDDNLGKKAHRQASGTAPVPRWTVLNKPTVLLLCLLEIIIIISQFRRPWAGRTEVVSCCCFCMKFPPGTLRTHSPPRPLSAVRWSTMGPVCSRVQ